MNAEKILEIAYKLVENLPDENKQTYDFLTKEKYSLNDAKNFPYDPTGAYTYVLVKALQEEIFAQQMKSSGKTNVLKAAKSIATGDAGSIQTADGVQYINNAYAIIRLTGNSVIPDVEITAERKLPTDRLENFFTEAEKTNGENLELPDIKDLKVYVKGEKARLKAKKIKLSPIYCFGENQPIINAETLVSALELVPNTTTVFAANRAIYGMDNNGNKWMILAVNRNSPEYAGMTRSC